LELSVTKLFSDFNTSDRESPASKCVAMGLDDEVS